MIILSLACRKSCLTYHLCDERDNHLLARGRVDLVSSGDSFLTLEVPGRETYRRQASCPPDRQPRAIREPRPEQVPTPATVTDPFDDD